MAKQPKKFGRFVVEGELGRGAMGVVYKGHDEKIGRAVALKTLLFDPLAAGEDATEAKDRFLVEAKATGQLAHPNILTIYDAGEEGDIAYIALEFLEGGDLQGMIEKGKFESYKQILSIVEKIALGLDHAHSKNIIHRDIKPANIMMAGGKEPKIADFGLARLQDSNLTTTGTVMGTPSYMAPEQVRGRSLDGRADLFSLGVILYEMLTGEKAFRGESITSVIYSVVNEEPIPPKDLVMDLPAGINNFMEKALAKDPNERFQTGKEFADAVKEVAEGKVGTYTKLADAGEKAGKLFGKARKAVVAGWKDDNKDPMIKIVAVGGAVLLVAIIGLVMFTGSDDAKINGSEKAEKVKKLSPEKIAKKAAEMRAKAIAKEKAKKEEAIKAKAKAEALAEIRSKRKTASRGVALLSITSKPSGAKIFINSRLVGETPYLKKRYQKKSYKVVVAKVGYIDWRGTINLSRNRTERLTLYKGKSKALLREEKSIAKHKRKIFAKKKAKKMQKTIDSKILKEKSEKASFFDTMFNPAKAGNIGQLIVKRAKGDKVTIDGKVYKGGRRDIVLSTSIGSHTIYVKRKGHARPFVKTVRVKRGYVTTVVPKFK